MVEREVPVVTKKVVCNQCNTLFQTNEAATGVCPSCGQELLRLTKYVACERCGMCFWVDNDAAKVKCPACEGELPSGTNDWYDVYLEEVNKPIPSGSRRNEKGDRTHSRMRAMRAKLAKFRRQSRYVLYD